MTADRRKRISRRLRFWGGMALLAVVGVGVLFWHSYRKAMGPPPTPPGKCPEFDKHLAEINDDWLFVFTEDGKVVVTDVYGENDRELVVPKTGAGADTLDPILGVSSNPEGKWAAICCVAKDPTSARGLTSLLGLINLRDFSMKPIKSDFIAGMGPGIRYIPLWLSDKTFLLHLPVHGTKDGYSPCLIYDLDDLEHPKTVQLPIDTFWLLQPCRIANDDVSHALLFLSEPDDSRNMKFKAYDKNGLRDATKEEEERFYVLATTEAGLFPGGGGGVPAFDTKELKRPAWLDWLFSRLGKPRSRKSKITLNEKRVRVGTCYDGTFIAIWFLRWDWDMRLFTWQELKTKDQTDSYYMDVEGHYRFWHRGSSWGKIPGWKVRSEEAVE